MVTEPQRGFVYVVCVFCAGAFSSISASTPVYVHDSNVRKLLFKDYNKDVRPASSDGKPTIVLYDITLFRLNGLDEMQHTMSTSFMLYKEWHDERLRWNKTDFGGLDNISVPVEKLWKPDMVLFNIVGQSYEHVYGADAFVRYDGSVMWIPMVTADTWCSLNFRKFPFDTQTCYMTFGSWIYSANQLIFRLASDSNATEKDGNIFSNDAEGNSANIEWNILKFTQGHRLVQYMEGIPDWAEVTVTLQLRRIGRYYQSLFVAPIVMLAALIPIVFLLPPDATEKPILGSLILLAICILLINLQSVMLPAHYAMPRLVMFYVSSLVLASVSVFVSAAVCNIAKRSKRLRGVPGWLGAIFLGRCGLRKVLCVEAYSPVSRFDSLIPTSDGMQPEEDDVGTEMTGAAENSTHRELREIRRCLYAMANKFNNDDSVNNLSREWYEIARVLDRLLLVIFYFLLFLTALAFLL